MLIGTVGELVMGNGEEVWALVKTSVIFVVRLSRMNSVEMVGGSVNSVESAMDSEQFVLEGDACQLMDFLNNICKEPHWDVLTILNDVKDIWSQFPSAITQAIPRSANGEAHNLAKRALVYMVFRVLALG
ncbi:hypothetical protein HHK36_018687 [Tetracentron sinense]|uniref:RNase H type-1 domain-containing protein n=1 Tax=Tetracentron sinense TaxID=13715 RepID=A0A834YWB5_TETSI|nr:hypothetical protein HHK36_018687 [Tetracentron sinense]